MRIAFPFVANDLALDFVNTRVRNRGDEIDLVESPDQMAKWVEVAGLSPRGTPWKAEDVAAARGLREAIREVMLALVDGAAPKAGAIDRINRHLADYDPNLLIAFDHGSYRLAQRRAAMTPVMVMGLLAERVATLLASEEKGRVRTCSHPDCILLFKDTSKSGRRRWCSMQTCGNRTKASTYRTNVERSGTRR